MQVLGSNILMPEFMSDKKGTLLDKRQQNTQRWCVTLLYQIFIFECTLFLIKQQGLNFGPNTTKYHDFAPCIDF